MTYREVIKTTDLTVQFRNKSFKLKGMAGTIHLPNNPSHVEMQKLADQMQEIFDRGRGKRREDKGIGKKVSIYDVRKVAQSVPKDGFHHEIGEAMEGILTRLDETYGRDDWTEEQQYLARVGIMAGIVSAALDSGRIRGLDEATDRLKKTIWGTD